MKPRKESANVSSPLKRRRARQIASYRVAVAGKSKDSHSAQQSSELKVLSKNSKLKICSNAGVKQKSFLSKRVALELLVMESAQATETPSDKNTWSTL